MERPSQERFTVGEWTAEPRLNRIRRAEETQQLDPRIMEVLVFLAGRPGEPVTKDELLDAVWGEVFVAENTLSQAISRLRRALGDDWRSPSYIETISKSGYRLIAPVTQRPPAAARPYAPLPHPMEGRPHSAPSWLRSFGWLAAALLAAAVALALFLWRPERPPFERLLGVHPAVTLLGQEATAALSPDGKQIAFAWAGPEGDNWDLYLAEADGDGPRRLTESPATEVLPAWSPDGRFLAYARPGPDQTCEIARMPASQGPSERLGDCKMNPQEMAWSDDGRRLAFSASSEAGSPSRIFLLEIGKEETTPLTSPPQGAGDRRPAFSPDSKQVTFQRRFSAGQDQLLSRAVEGGGEPSLLFSEAGVRIIGHDWTREGQIIISTDRAGRPDLWHFDPGTKEIGARLTAGSAWVTIPRTARNSRRLIFDAIRDLTYLYALPLQSPGKALGEPVPLLNSSRSQRSPRPSPDGSRVAFLSDRSGALELWSGDGLPAGQDSPEELLRHSDLGGPLLGPAVWSPDGGRLVFEAYRFGHADLFSVSGQGRDAERLTDHPSNEINPAFSTDGRWLYFASDRSGQWQIHRMPSAGGPAEQATRQGGFRALPDPRGRGLLYSRYPSAEIWRIDAGQDELVLAGLAKTDWGNWAVQAQGVYLVGRSPSRIDFHPFDESRPTQTVVTLQKSIPAGFSCLSLSGQGDTLYFTLIEQSEDEIMMADY